MNQTWLNGKTLVVFCGLLASTTFAVAEDRPADKILAEINAVELPKVPKDQTNQEAIKEFLANRTAAMAKRAELIGELYKANPDQPELVALLPQRWNVIRSNKATVDVFKAEAAEVLAKSKNEKLLTEASFQTVLCAILDSESKKTVDPMKAVNSFIEKYPKDLRAPSLLMMFASETDDFDVKEAIFKRVEKDYSNTTAAKQVPGYRARAEGEREVLTRVGKPFELEFTEATKGTQITMASLKGKVVVIDFWATWCGPCIAEMPNMKKLYAEYKDKGVEFIGVSLDLPKEKGGLDKLKDYVAKNEVEWPQYYQGNFWQSEFSTSWKVSGIPCVFLIDADGNLATPKARGKLETLIPEYLAKAKTKKTASAP
jgi:thiol-disulfide isomerase/thioredoxin